MDLLWFKLISFGFELKVEFDKIQQTILVHLKRFVVQFKIGYEVEITIVRGL